MNRRFLLCFGFVLCISTFLYARTYTEAEARNAWKSLQNQPLNETTFRESCDLLQDIAQTNIGLSYIFLEEYEPIIRTSGNRRWLHILLMGWAKAKESLTAFPEAEILYSKARLNAAGDSRSYNEALVGTILMFLEWSRKDSLAKYVDLGEKACRQSNDSENLSFVYTFKALSDMADTSAMRKYLDSAIALSLNLPNKNALFTARYNRAIFYSQFDLQEQTSALESLMELSKDSSISKKPRLYERTAFSFRNGTASIYYQLMLVNLLLTDYDHAWKFAELFYKVTILPNPKSPQAPYFNSVMALVKAYQNDYKNAKEYLSQSLSLFNMPEDSIGYPTYHLAAGMIASYENNPQLALKHFEIADHNGNMSYGLHLMPPAIYYARELILTGQWEAAEQKFSEMRPMLQTRKYSAIGYYYYKYYAEFLKARQNPAYSSAQETYYNIKDSLANINHYRAVEEVETRMRVREKEMDIARLDEENASKLNEIHLERKYFTIFTTLAAVILLLLGVFWKNRREKKQKIAVMQGAIDAEERERRKIADQLHDETGSLLALANLNLSSALEHGNSDVKIIDAHKILSDVSSTIREISHRLTPLAIEKNGFKKAITDLDYSVNLSQKIKLDTLIIGFDDDSRYPVSKLNDLYRIIQELLHNILKHADAKSARLELIEHDDSISVIVEDDGKGLQINEIPKGKGLLSVRAKIAYLNGKMEIMTKREGGTLIIMEINHNLK